jgi:hypothetical protein
MAVVVHNQQNLVLDRTLERDWALLSIDVIVQVLAKTGAHRA